MRTKVKRIVTDAGVGVRREGADRAPEDQRRHPRVRTRPGRSAGGCTRRAPRRLKERSTCRSKSVAGRVAWRTMVIAL